MRTQATDLTQGGILRKILMVALPLMGTQLLQMTYNLTDMFWLGRMEDAVSAVAASGLAGMFMWLGMALMLYGRMGAEIGVSQNLGAGNRERAQSFAEQASRMALALGLVYALVLVLIPGPLISLLRVQEQSVFDKARDYLRIVALGIPFTYVSAAISGGMSGSGNSRLAFIANATGLLANMVLDPLMIFGLGWGVMGAAVATLIAQAIVCLLLLRIVKGHSQRPFEGFKLLGGFIKEQVGQIFKWSLPVSLESGAFTMLAMVVTGMVASGYGESAVAAQRVGTQIESLSWLIGGGFSSAVAAFMGQNFGGRKWSRIRRAYKISLTSLLLWEAIVVLILIFGGRFLFALFLNDPPELVDIGHQYLLILAFSQPFMALEGTCAGTFRGMGKTLPPSVSSISTHLLRPLICWGLSQVYGLNGIFMGISLTAALRGLIMFVWFTAFQKKIPLSDGEPLLG